MSSLARLVVAPVYRYIAYLGNLIGSICDCETFPLSNSSSCMTVVSKGADMHSLARYDYAYLMTRS